MANGTDNTNVNATDNNQNNNEGQQRGQTSGNENDGIDANIAKHLDMAIEAQDGKEPTDNAQTDAEKEAAKKEAEVQGQPKDRESGSGDSTGKQKPTKEASEAGKTLARAKDLVLKGQGPDGADVVIKGGPERRFYEQMHIAREERDAERRAHEITQRRNSDLEAEINALRGATQSTHGMDPQDVAIGARIMGDLKRSPIETLKKLVAEAAAQGYNVEELGVGVDTQAIARILEERLPKNTQTGPTEEDIKVEAANEWNAFISRHPDAPLHDKLFAAVLQEHPDWSLDQVYFNTKSAFADKGFDWSKSLENNLQELSQEQQGNEGQQDPTKRNEAPLPGGGNSGGDGDFSLNGPGQASDDMDMGDIVRAAMREHGHKV